MSEFPPSDELTSGQANSVHTNAIQGGDLLMWTIYRSPKDYPGKFIARPHSIRRQIAYRCHLAADDIYQLRNLLPRGLTRINRDPNDEPQIMETWM